jgi:hypothetical protein
MKRMSQSAAVVLLAGSVSLFALNPPQKQNPNQNQDRGQHPAPPARVQNNAPRPGKWLQQHLNDSPQDQQRQLQNDNDFKKLTPEQQRHLQEKLNQFNSLPPQQRERIAKRLLAMEELPPDKQQLLRNSLQQFKQMPDDRRRMMRHAWNSLRQMPPDQQEQVMNSDRFRSSFSDQERSTLKGLLDSGFNPEENNGGPAPQ